MVSDIISSPHWWLQIALLPNTCHPSRSFTGTIVFFPSTINKQHHRHFIHWAPSRVFKGNTQIQSLINIHCISFPALKMTAIQGHSLFQTLHTSPSVLSAASLHWNRVRNPTTLFWWAYLLLTSTKHPLACGGPRTENHRAFHMITTQGFLQETNTALRLGDQSREAPLNTARTRRQRESSQKAF